MARQKLGPRQLIAARFEKEEYGALRVLAAADRRPLGPYLEMLAIRHMNEPAQQEKIQKYVAKHGRLATKDTNSDDRSAA